MFNALMPDIAYIMEWKSGAPKMIDAGAFAVAIQVVAVDDAEARAGFCDRAAKRCMPQKGKMKVAGILFRFGRFTHNSDKMCVNFIDDC